MTNEEKYYRRTYALLEELMYTYRNGYNKQEMHNFWQKNFYEYASGSQVYNEKKEGLLLTIIIALMGVNKESIEKREVINEYKLSLVQDDFRNLLLDNLTKEKVLDFESLRTVTTAFDDWLSIVKCPVSDKNNEDIIRRIRNGLLHSNFVIDAESNVISFTHIKTKSYYESKILNQNFQQFILAYYSNVPTVGLCDKTVLFYKNSYENITNEDKLRNHLKNLSMLEIEYSVDNFDGFNSLDNVFSKILKQNNRERKIKKELNNNENGINIKEVFEKELSDDSVEIIINLINKRFGEVFYKLSDITKEKLIINILEYFYENKRQLSNWLLHFSHLINNTINSKYSVYDNFYLDDEYAVLSLNPTLSILKGYLILYRLQNNKFDDINYDLIEFMPDDDYYFWSEKNGEIVEKDYFQESFDRIREKDNKSSNEKIFKQIICEVIRDSFAHGNITSFIDKDGIDCIEIKDIHPKNKQTRCIQMTLEKFNRFLSSEAFLPKYCIKKEEKNKFMKLIKKII